MSKIKFNEISVVDLEATTADPKNRNIIELGVCFLNLSSFQVIDKASFFIKPIDQKLTDYCSNLTGITQLDLNDAATLEEVCEYLRNEYKTHKKPWASFGAFDRNVLEQQCSAHNIRFPFTRNHIDIKSLFSAKHCANKPFGLQSALKKLNLKFEGIHHSADDDAYNAAKVLAALI